MKSWETWEAAYFVNGRPMLLPGPPTMPFSERLRSFRRLTALTQRQVGLAVGVSTSLVKKWEAGDCWPSLETRAKLHRLLDGKESA